MYVLHIPSWFPIGKDPYLGNFIEKHIAAASMHYPCVTLRVSEYGGKPEGRTVEKTGNNTVITYYLPEAGTIFKKVVSRFKRYRLYRQGAAFIRKKYGIPRVIHLHVALPMGTFAAKLSKKWKVPLVLSEHWSIYQPRNRGKISASKFRKLKTVFNTVDVFTAVSKDLQQKVEELFPLKQYFIIPNVVDVNTFHWNAETGNMKKTMIHISDLNDQIKNFSGILHVIKKLSLKRDDFVLKVIHDNRNEQAEQFVKENRLDDFVQFLGSKTEEEVACELMHSDFLVLFSNYENLPCVIIEAFACGIPVLATSVGGIPEIVDDSRGILVDSKDETALEEKMNWLLDHFHSYNHAGILKYADEHFSNEVIGKAFFEVYRKLGADGLKQ